MKTSTFLWVVAVVVVLGGIAWVSYPKALNALGAASTTGSTNSTAKIASVAMAPQSNSASSTSILNTDASDRIITDAGVSCTGLSSMNGLDGAGLATYNWYAATSSVPAPTASISTATLAAMSVSVATSSSDGYTATSTYANPFSRRWNAGSYLIFQTNGTSTATTCTPFVHYIAS